MDRQFSVNFDSLQRNRILVAIFRSNGTNPSGILPKFSKIKIKLILLVEKKKEFSHHMRQFPMTSKYCLPYYHDGTSCESNPYCTLLQTRNQTDTCLHSSSNENFSFLLIIITQYNTLTKFRGETTLVSYE